MTCPRCTPYRVDLGPGESIACRWCAESASSAPADPPAATSTRPRIVSGAAEAHGASDAPRLRTVRSRGVQRAGVADRTDPLAVLRAEVAALLVVLDAAERLSAASGSGGIDYARPLVQRSPSTPTPSSVGSSIAETARWASQRVESLRLVPLRGPPTVRDVSVGDVLGWIAQHCPPEPWPEIVGHRYALADRIAREFGRSKVRAEWLRAESRGVAAPIRRQAAEQQRAIGVAVLRRVVTVWSDRDRVTAPAHGSAEAARYDGA